MNGAWVIGRLGQDPLLKTLPNGKNQVCEFTLAEDMPGKDTKPQWHRIKCFDKTAVFAEKYLQKGTPCTIAGQIKVRDYTDKDGKKRTVVEIVANTIRPHQWKEQDEFGGLGGD